jgi:hypothetical protein
MKPGNRFRPAVESLELVNLLSVAIPAVGAPPEHIVPPSVVHRPIKIDGSIDGKRLVLKNTVYFTGKGELTINDVSIAVEISGRVHPDERPYPGYVNIITDKGIIYVGLEWQPVGYLFDVSGGTKTFVDVIGKGRLFANSIPGDPAYRLYNFVGATFTVKP